MPSEASLPPRPAEPALCEVGDFLFDSTRRELRLGNEAIALSRQQFDLLSVLVEWSGEVVAYPILQARIWHSEPVAPGAIAQAALVLRRVLRRSVVKPLALVTVRGVGFRLDGPIVRRTAAEALATGSTLRLLLLPVANAAGPAHDFGLPGLLQLLATGLRLPGRLEPALAAGFQRPSGAPSAGVVHDVVLRLHLGQQGDWLALDAVASRSGLAPQPPLLAECVLGVDLLDMTRRLAKQIQQVLLRDDTAQSTPVFPWRDDWANLTYARASAFIVQQDYRSALPMLRALDQCAPRHPLGMLALLRALAVESPQEVPNRAKALLRMHGLTADVLALGKR